MIFKHRNHKPIYTIRTSSENIQKIMDLFPLAFRLKNKYTINVTLSDEDLTFLKLRLGITPNARIGYVLGQDKIYKDE